MEATLGVIEHLADELTVAALDESGQLKPQLAIDITADLKSGTCLMSRCDTRGVQIVDASELWIRVVVLTLRRRGSPLTFVLFPMIHVGSPQFYESVRAQVAECDLAVVEGLGKSVPTSLLTLAYRVVRFNRRSGLIVQNLRPDSFGVPVVHPDMTGSDFRRGWRRVPWLHRMMLWCMVPAMVLIMLVVGPRRLLAQHASLDDEPTLQELNATASMPELHELVVDERDRLLVEALTKLHEQRCHEPIKVAVVYGAGHMPGVVYALSSRLGYSVRNGRWVTVVDL